MRFVDCRKMLMIGAVALAVVTSVSDANAGSLRIIDRGPGWWTTEFTVSDADHTAGTIVVTSLIIVNGRTTQGFQVLNTLDSVNASVGWSANIKKDGGLDGTIEIAFTSDDDCKVRFKHIVIPGLTKTHLGAFKCKKKK